MSSFEGSGSRSPRIRHIAKLLCSRAATGNDSHLRKARKAQDAHSTLLKEHSSHHQLIQNTAEMACVCAEKLGDMDAFLGRAITPTWTPERVHLLGPISVPGFLPDQTSSPRGYPGAVNFDLLWLPARGRCLPPHTAAFQT